MVKKLQICKCFFFFWLKSYEMAILSIFKEANSKIATRVWQIKTNFSFLLLFFNVKNKRKRDANHFLSRDCERIFQRRQKGTSSSRKVRSCLLKKKNKTGCKGRRRKVFPKLLPVTWKVKSQENHRLVHAVTKSREYYQLPPISILALVD